MNPSASRCFICGYKTAVNDKRQLPMFLVTKSRMPEWEKILPQKGLKVGVKLCSDHFDDAYILKGKMVSGKFYAYRRHRLTTGALPKHYLDGSIGQETEVIYSDCKQTVNLHSCNEIDPLTSKETKFTSNGDQRRGLLQSRIGKG